MEKDDFVVVFDQLKNLREGTLIDKSKLTINFERVLEALEATIDPKTLQRETSPILRGNVSPAGVLFNAVSNKVEESFQTIFNNKARLSHFYISVGFIFIDKTQTLSADTMGNVILDSSPMLVMADDPARYRVGNPYPNIPPSFGKNGPTTHMQNQFHTLQNGAGLGLYGNYTPEQVVDRALNDFYLATVKAGSAETGWV